MTFTRVGNLYALILLAAVLGISQICLAQATSGNQSWTATSQQESPDGTMNPTRTTESHTEIDGRIVDKTSVERLGPDGRYVPYSDTEKESIRVNDTTVRNTERTFGRDSDGHMTLIQETQEESRSLPGNELQVTRMISNPDANGAMQVVRQESEDSKQLNPGVRVTNTTVLTPHLNGGLSPAVQTEQRETRGNDGTIESKKSTFLSDGTGQWKLAEVRESTTKPEGPEVRTNEERVLRPNSDGNLAVVERTVNKQNQARLGEKRDTAETYSTNVPGQAGDDSLQLVQRETTIQRSTSTGARSTTRQVEQPSPGAPNGSLQVTEEAIDIVRPGESGTANQTRTVLTPGSDGRLDQVWVDTGKTDNPSAIHVDIGTSTKPQ
jgi:hypothetical protein